MNTSMIDQVSVSGDFPSLRGEELSKIKRRAELYIIDVINESFIHTADQDYVNARSHIKSFSANNFFWSSAQCLEKYFKGFLIAKGENIKEYSHNIYDLFELAKQYSKPLGDFQFKTDITALGYGPHILTKYSVKSFISEISKYGKASQRYNQSSTDYNISLIYYLDEFVRFFKESVLMVNYEESFEEICPSLKQNLHYKNLYLKSEYNENTPIIIDHLTATTLDFLKRNDNRNSACKYALIWLKKRMRTN